MTRLEHLCLALAMFALASCSSKPENDKDLQAAFSNVLKDPSSVQFQNVGETQNVICGEYNAKNSYGAYDGFEAFSYNRKTQTLVTEQDARAEAGTTYGAFLNSLNGCDKDNKIFFGMVHRSGRALEERLHQ
jgi:hypothetical protein